MNIENQLLKEHSKSNTTLISDYIGDSIFLFDELINCISNPEVKIHQRAAAVLGSVCEKHELGFGM